MTIVFISDFFKRDILGGGEICDDILKRKLSENFIVEEIRSHECTVSFLKDRAYELFIISNFVNLSEDCKTFLVNNTRYIIYEHDYKFLKSRNPQLFENMKAKDSDIINRSFYEKSSMIICQSDLQAEIFKINLGTSNIASIGVNFWDDSSFELMKEMSRKEKKNKTAILKSENWIKNQRGAEAFCLGNYFRFEVISDSNYENFLRKLGEFESFVFLPLSPETFSRTCAEARMMNVKVYASENVGFLNETWQKGLFGSDLINEIKERSRRAFSLFESFA